MKSYEFPDCTVVKVNKILAEDNNQILIEYVYEGDKQQLWINALNQK